MGMRETVGSLRAYFVLTGLLGLLSVVSVLRANSVGPLALVMEAVSLAFSVAFIYVGFSLARLLSTSANRIIGLLYASAGWTVLLFILSLLGGMSPFAIVVFVVSLLILWYLLKNVRRPHQRPLRMPKC